MVDIVHTGSKGEMDCSQPRNVDRQKDRKPDNDKISGGGKSAKIFKKTENPPIASAALISDSGDPAGGGPK